MSKIKKSKFNCDTNGGIMVVSALRYALGSHTYVPGAVQDWISLHWDSLDSNTKIVILRDVFEHLYDDSRPSAYRTSMTDYDLSTWRKFGIEHYWKLDYDERKNLEQHILADKNRVIWYTQEIMPKIYENTK
jgi:hypothetical protein